MPETSHPEPRYLFAVVPPPAVARLRAGEAVAGAPAFAGWDEAAARGAREGGLVFAVDGARIDASAATSGASSMTIARLDPRAVCDLEPGFREETCGGGLLVRRAGAGADGAEVALVRVRRRSGATIVEAPKGHLEDGESPRDAAVREVREELGLADGIVLDVVAPLVCTRHVFRKKDRDDGAPRLKTTHWFLLRCAARDPAFAPQGDEGILSVFWAPLADAERLVGYDNLRAPFVAARALVAARPEVVA